MVYVPAFMRGEVNAPVESVRTLRCIIVIFQMMRCKLYTDAPIFCLTVTPADGHIVGVRGGEARCLSANVSTGRGRDIALDAEAFPE